MDIGKFHVFGWLGIDGWRPSSCMGETCKVHVQKSPGTVESVNIDVSDVVLVVLLVFPFHINHTLLVVVLSSRFIQSWRWIATPRPWWCSQRISVAWNWVTALSNPESSEPVCAFWWPRHLRIRIFKVSFYFLQPWPCHLWLALLLLRVPCSFFFPAFILRQAVKDGNSPNLSPANQSPQNKASSVL